MKLLAPLEWITILQLPEKCSAVAVGLVGKHYRFVTVEITCYGRNSCNRGW
jgi:hypothetical protein